MTTNHLPSRKNPVLTEFPHNYEFPLPMYESKEPHHHKSKERGRKREVHMCNNH